MNRSLVGQSNVVESTGHSWIRIHATVTELMRVADEVYLAAFAGVQPPAKIFAGWLIVKVLMRG